MYTENFSNCKAGECSGQAGKSCDCVPRDRSSVTLSLLMLIITLVIAYHGDRPRIR